MKRWVTVLQFQIDDKKNQTRVGKAIKKKQWCKFVVNEISTAYFHVTQGQKNKINYGFYFLWRTEATPIQTIELKYLHTDVFPSLELKKNSSGTCVIILYNPKKKSYHSSMKTFTDKKTGWGGGLRKKNKPRNKKKQNK